LKVKIVRVLLGRNANVNANIVARGHFGVGLDTLDHLDDNPFGGKASFSRALVE